MAKKKASRTRPTQRLSAEDESAQRGSDRLVGGVYHNGRMYDHRKSSDQKAFAALLEKEGLAPAGVEKSERSKAHKEALQRLADQGAVKGYGTKAAAKKAAKSDEDAGDPENSTEVLSQEDAMAQQAELQEDEEE